jgi:cation diffusion facilitator family transporter
MKLLRENAATSTNSSIEKALAAPASQGVHVKRASHLIANRIRQRKRIPNKLVEVHAAGRRKRLRLDGANRQRRVRVNQGKDRSREQDGGLPNNGRVGREPNQVIKVAPRDPKSARGDNPKRQHNPGCQTDGIDAQPRRSRGIFPEVVSCGGIAHECGARCSIVPSNSPERVVRIAVLTNAAVAACKYAAAIATGSSAMMAEAFHSTADTGNELLLLLGMKRSDRPPDALHPYGHGKALYFYSLLVAIYIFAVGAGLSFYHGVSNILRPESSSHPGWNYGVLAFAAVFDLYSWQVSYRQLVSQKEPNESKWQEIIGSKDPSAFTVFLEDSAGLIGALLAFLGIFLGRLLHNPYLDPTASILIGVLLSAVALLLGRESGALLIGERTNRARIRLVRQIIEKDPSVQALGDILTMQLGPNHVLLTVDIRFHRSLSIEQVEASIAQIETNIREAEPMIDRIFIEVNRLENPAASSAKSTGSESQRLTEIRG